MARLYLFECGHTPMHFQMGRHPFGCGFDGGGGRLVDHPLAQGREYLRRFQLAEQLPFEIGDPLDGNLPHQSVRAAVEDGDLPLDGHRAVLRLH